MTTLPTPNPSRSSTENVSAAPPKTQARSNRDRISLFLQLTLSLAIAGSVFGYLIWSGTAAPRADDEKRPSRPEETVQVVGPGLIRIRPGTPLDDKLDQTAKVRAAWLTAPLLPVTGTSSASLRPGKETAQDSWQFATPDLLTAFSDWQKAVVDVQFQTTLLPTIRELAGFRVEAQKEVVGRMEKLLTAGDQTEKALVAERVNLKTFEIQGKREIHEGENALKVAQKTEATLARQLQQAGLEPTMLRSAAAEGEIVVAEVPERAVGLVKLGMTSEVRFFALPDRVFTGKVSTMSPVISKDKRVLNVQFIVKDPDKVVRPGMFAEIGLGTDKREALLMPADGVLHVGDRDYALLGTEAGTWKVQEVRTGELRGTDVELLEGTPYQWKAGDRVMGKGAILLKPVVVRALQPSAGKAS
jgi:cobalt-zinc-cadmium efflux system membrane fusion protein